MCVYARAHSCIQMFYAECMNVCVVLSTCTHTHTRIHAYIHTYMHVYMHTCIHTYMHSHGRAGAHAMLFSTGIVGGWHSFPGFNAFCERNQEGAVWCNGTCRDAHESQWPVSQQVCLCVCVCAYANIYMRAYANIYTLGVTDIFAMHMEANGQYLSKVCLRICVRICKNTLCKYVHNWRDGTFHHAHGSRWSVSMQVCACIFVCVSTCVVHMHMIMFPQTNARVYMLHTDTHTYILYVYTQHTLKFLTIYSQYQHTVTPQNSRSTHTYVHNIDTHRVLSFKGATFEILIQDLDANMESMYDAASDFWADLMTDFISSRGVNGFFARKSIMWGAHQRFWVRMYVV
jgi:hypothetical protein